MKRTVVGIIMAAFLLIFGAQGAMAEVDLLHHFDGVEGSNPYHSPVESGGRLYGLTNTGGGSDLGVVYAMDPDGSNFEILHEFVGGAADGSKPYGAPVVDGTVLYGLTWGGGVNDRGTIFRIDTDGTDFSVMYSFAAGTTSGVYPNDGAALDSGIIYGCCPYGGANGSGILFKYEIGGAGFGIVHSFAGGVGGSTPYYGVTVADGVIYGVTNGGGDNDLGTLWKIGTDGNGFEVLVHFDGVGNGRMPGGMPTVEGSVIYHTAMAGGPVNEGNLFKVNTDGTGFEVLYWFGADANDGDNPENGPLVITDGNIYGSTGSGGPDNAGTLYCIATDGTGYTQVHAFDHTTGYHPYGNPTLVDGALIGATYSGGVNVEGVIYKYEIGTASGDPECFIGAMLHERRPNGKAVDRPSGFLKWMRGR